MSLILWVIALVVVLISKFWYRWSNPTCKGKLPPGSSGFPIIGETREFLTPHGFYEISPFTKKRMSMYGPLFRTNLFGSNTVASTDMDVNWDVLREENKSFVVSYQNSVGKLFGDNNVFQKHGEVHKHIKKIALGFLGSDGLKRTMIGDLDQMTQVHFRSKAALGSFDVEKAVIDFALNFITPKIMSNLKPEKQTKLINHVNAFNFDWCKPDINISSLRSFFKALKGRRGAIQMIKDVCTQRIVSRAKLTDFLHTLLEDLEKDGSLLSQGSVENLTFFLILTARESTSKIITFAVKFLFENPKVLAELKREHAAILESREDKESGITWEEYRHKMNFTSMVINEVLRLSNGVPVLFRKTVKDVEIKGYMIPAGWSVVVVPTVVHFNPNVYENPLEFDPWRWEGKDVRSGSKTFMPFGGGMRQCAGAEFARLQISIYLHYLVTKYDFRVVQDCEVVRLAALFFKKGLHIELIPSPPNTHLHTSS